MFSQQETAINTELFWGIQDKESSPCSQCRCSHVGLTNYTVPDLPKTYSSGTCGELDVCVGLDCSESAE